jgi:branched-chain amino acid transport system ATP-binding protein
MAILEVQDIHTYYGDAYVLQGLSLRLEEGQILGLLGRNGVGKTTLVNSIVGFNRPRRGKIVFKGVDITAASSFETVRSGMGLVPQGRRVFPTLSVEENLMVAERSVDRRGWNLERVYVLFPRLRERRSQRARTLSGGEQQMLAIGRALMTRAPMILVDEPSLGLAPKIIEQIYKILLDLRVREKLTLLINEQSSHRVLKHADRIYVLRAGQIRLKGTAEQLADGHAIKEAYFGFHEQQAAG